MSYKNVILIHTPSPDEGIYLQNLLKEKQLDSFCCGDIETLLTSLNDDVGTLLISKEALQPALIEALDFYLKQQPKWSQLPVILLIEQNDLSQSEKDFETLSPIENLILLEKPVQRSALLSVIQNCLNNRAHQYEVQSLLTKLAESKTEILKAKDEAADAHRAKNEFLSNMSHEIRTPLGAVMGFSDLICQSRLSRDEREEYALTIRRNGQQLSDLIEDILDITKIESGKLIIEEIDCSLDDVMTEVLNSLRFRSLLKNIPIKIEKAPLIPNAIKTDPTRLKQILSNLLGNALKFTSEGSINIRISLEGRGLIFEITDSGIGIAPENHSKLFQAFSQIDGSITRRYGGTGLGLALSRKLARALGGDLNLKSSRLGEGSIFEFFINYNPSDHQSRSFFISPKKSTADSLRGMKILVADDSADNQTLLSEMLTKEGAEVKIVGDGEEAFCKALEEDFNVVLMDVQMPKLSGLEATKKLRKEGYPKPIVALSAYAMSEDRIRGLSAGCDLYLTKPVDRKKLVNLLQNYTQQPSEPLSFSLYSPN